VAGLGVVAGLSLAVLGTPAQMPALNAPLPGKARPAKDRTIPDRFPAQPTLAPSWSIPVEPLGFSPPGPLYMGSRNALASMDFIGEDKLLFTFRVPGLMHRDAAGSDSDGEERQIRAVVLSLPTGAALAEATWTVHDRARYLWMLGDGHFLLRDRNNLMLGDASLNLKPFLQFPGPLLWLEVDPTEQYLVTDSHEPEKSAAASTSGEVQSPATAAASMSSSDMGEDSADNGAPETVVRIMRRDTGKVMLFSRVRTTVHLPINSVGYVETLQGQRWNRIVNLSYFSGGSKMLGSVESQCDLTEDFVSDKLILVTACQADGEDRLVAMTTDGRSLWSDQTPAVAIWPKVIAARGGLRIARETLGVSHPVNAYQPLDVDDIKGQWVTVYDAATGDMALETQASPALDSGGNVALSASGRRVAVLNAGAIQVFELAAPPALPDAAGNHP
jgi:hypothetical protein